jgi:RNA polymerase sigma-70 factor (ECF subfamily)
VTDLGGRLPVVADRVSLALAAADREMLLLDRAARGEVEAFDALLRPRLERLCRVAVAITRSEADARDAVQEASALAWRQLPRLRDRTRFDPWLSQIVVNACRGLLRRQNRRRVREIDVNDAEQAVSEIRASAASAPDAIAEAEAVQRAFLRLDPGARALIALHYVEHRPLGEIGEILGIPVGTVKWRLFRARRVLDAALKAEDR